MHESVAQKTVGEVVYLLLKENLISIAVGVLSVRKTRKRVYLACLLSPVPRFRGDKLLPFYFPASIFLFIRVAVTAAEKPLSMLTTVTPAEQLFIIVKRAESPSKLEP